MRVPIIILLCTVALSGCATPGVLFTEQDREIKITPVPREGIMALLLGQGLPAGDYECQFGEHKKAKFSTKADLKLFDFNASKIGE